MKKVLVSVVACMFAMFAAATETANVRITLKSNSGTTNAVRLAEDDAYTNAYEDGADADKMMVQSNSKSVLMYAMVDDHICGNVVALSLEGLKLGFTTNKVDNAYTLSFDQFSGRELKMYDKVADEIITINTTTADYNFTVAAEQVGQVAITDRFVMGAPVPGICHQNGKLEITAYKGASVTIVDYDDNTDVRLAATSVTKNYDEIDLANVAATGTSGQLLVIITKADQSEEKLVIKK